MASVQAAPGFPAQGVNGQLPAQLTKETVQQAYAKYQSMKAQGVAENDPEFVKLKNILTLVQQRSQYAKAQMQKQQMQKQAQQQALQQMQQNGASTHVGSNGNTTSAPPAAEGTASSTAPAGSPAAAPTVAPSQEDKNGTTPASAAPHVFTPEQMNLLRIQITAFKRLSKNLPIPENVQQILSQSRLRKSSTPAEVPTSASSALEDVRQSVQQSVADGAKSADQPKRYEDFKDPWQLIFPDGAISYSDHALRSKRTILPSIMPVGIDLEKWREERENIVYNRIQARKAELEKLPTTIGAWNTAKTDTPQDDGSMKLKALIEYKKLGLLPKQRILREQIQREMLHADNLAMTANRANFRRMKKQSLREARITEKLEKQQRDARETKEKKKQTDFLHSITRHQEEVVKAAQDARSRVQKLGRLMVQTHTNIEKEEQKRIERTAKQRLQALKANDEETYLKLLGQAKDTRISHLLKQTDGFLKQLASSVKDQQRNAKKRFGDRATPESDSESEDYDSDAAEDGARRGKRVDYYEVAHRIKEDVKQQSSNLVGGQLKEYQLKGLQWMISLYNNNLNGILADEMGLGKTIQTISLVTYLIEKKNQPGPYLVIVPLSTLMNWSNEFQKWAPSVPVIVYKGPPNARKQAQQQIRWGNFQVLLTTYEFIIKDRPVLSKVKWVHMIVDEGHRMKNSQSKLSSTITQYYTTRYRLILTGTPLQNNLAELWAMLNFVLPAIFKSVKSFDEWFNTPFANTGGQDKMDLSEEEQLLVIRRLHKVLRPFLLRRLKKDVEKDLPDKQERVIKCNFSALQAKLYKQLVTNQRLVVSDGKGGKTGMRGLSNMLMQLRKLCNHPFVFEEVEDQINPSRITNDTLWRTAGKFELLDRILPKFQATGHRVLMFFQMTAIMNIMEDFLRLRNMNYLRLDGSTKSEDRAELLKLFNAPGSPYFIFLLSTRAGGLGLNLQTADTVIIYDSDWNPHQDLQAQDRAHRIGQKNEVRILRLITSNSVEEKILERANFKLDMDGKVIQAGKFDNKSTNEERDAMLRIMLESAEAAEDLSSEEMDDDDMNVIMMRTDAELEKFRAMDAERIRNDRYGTGKKYPRLFSEEELPEIYMNDDNAVVEEIEENLGRGTRERTRVKYDDGLTEEQWLEAVDNSDDDVEAAIARKEAKVARRAANKSKKGGPGDGASPMPSRQSSEEPQPKKRGRKPKAETLKRKAEAAAMDEDSTPAPRKRGRQAKVTETLTSTQRERLQQLLDEVWDVIMDLEEPIAEAADGVMRGLSDPFMDLPDRTDYPDYYQLIQRPICLNQIANKINKKQYQGTREFYQDVKLLCQNCRTYNEDTSLLYQDANRIENEFTRKLQEVTAGTEFADFDDGENGVDGQSTAMQSSVGTPLAAG